MCDLSNIKHMNYPQFCSLLSENYYKKTIILKDKYACTNIHAYNFMTCFNKK